jgi:hypothetical protein
MTMKQTLSRRDAGHLKRSVLVFVSHASADCWVAEQIARGIRSTGASTFLDAFDLAHGDNFNDEIRKALLDCTELVALMTPTAIARPYVWMELGAMWGQDKRMVLVLQGLTIVEFQADGSIPDMIKALDHLEINDIKGYFRQLRRRVRIGSGNAQ